jgi:hypothetical protein
MFQQVVSMSGCVYVFHSLSAFYPPLIPSYRCASTPLQSQLACLRAVNSSVLEEANTVICASAFFGTFAFVPVVDGELIRESPGKQLSAGAVNGVSVSAYDFLAIVDLMFSFIELELRM